MKFHKFSAWMRLSQLTLFQVINKLWLLMLWMVKFLEMISTPMLVTTVNTRKNWEMQSLHLLLMYQWPQTISMSINHQDPMATKIWHFLLISLLNYLLQVKVPITICVMEWNIFGIIRVPVSMLLLIVVFNKSQTILFKMFSFLSNGHLLPHNLRSNLLKHLIITLFQQILTNFLDPTHSRSCKLTMVEISCFITWDIMPLTHI